MKHAILTVISGACAVCLIGITGVSLFWAIDPRPVLSRNISTPESPVFERGGVLRIVRDVVKERDCPMVASSHHIIGEDRSITILQRSTGALVRAGKHKFVVGLKLPKDIKPGRYHHEVRLHYACNPIKTMVVRAKTPPFEIR